MDILSAERLTKVYGQGPTALKALDSVTLSIGQGEFVAIVGSSGSGKSTLLHLMGGVDRPTSGTVRLAGARWGWSTSSTTSSPCSTRWRT